MEITWLGHSCFRLKGKQATIITDPFSPGIGYVLGKQSAQIVTVSHAHSDHSYVQGISGEPKIINGPGEYEISGVMTIGVQTYHDSEHGVNKGKNTAFFMEIDEVKVCHLGDLGHVLTTEQVARLNGVDVLMIPVGGVTTIDATHAAEVIRSLEPKIVIPMHYKTEALKMELAPIDQFLKEMGVKEIIPQPKLLVTKANLPLSLQVVLLEYNR
jgi:L-ascorbate metabolism protein UlaG (beta-lactamase superfamily)